MPTPVSILATETHTLQSATGETYAINIALPYQYTSDGKQGGPFSRAYDTFPVVYLTDANWHFGMVTDFVREMAWCGRTFPAIIVGIGYPESPTDSPQETWRNVSVRRSYDLTLVHTDEDDERDAGFINRKITTGGGEQFFAFLKDQLIPWVEQNYRADPVQRIMAGHSFGGLFALYAALQQPELFRSYVVISPFLLPGNYGLITTAQQYAETHHDLKAQIYFAAGGLEDSDDDSTIRDMDRFIAQLTTHNYQGLTISREIFPDNNHCEVAAPALHAGLKWALKRDSTK